MDRLPARWKSADMAPTQRIDFGTKTELTGERSCDRWPCATYRR